MTRSSDRPSDTRLRAAEALGADTAPFAWTALLPTSIFNDIDGLRAPADAAAPNYLKRFAVTVVRKITVGSIGRQ